MRVAGPLLHLFHMLFQLHHSRFREGQRKAPTLSRAASVRSPVRKLEQQGANDADAKEDGALQPASLRLGGLGVRNGSALIRSIRDRS